ncbi:MAG: ABC transporter ATP-binding protein/permease [Cyclobacteriaceae bacterium]|nr:ABC transporter ATP-binding protein/permease [Cyclobacteriaceae bacterium]MDW8331828.1 ABC transporter ATP-binding protein [Cyclobacteriaceae bacterium]
MNVYFRILRLAPRLIPQLTKFFVFSLLGVLFSAAYLGLIMPMLEVLFNQATSGNVPEPPVPAFSINYLRDYFKYRYALVIVEQGPVSALLWVCVLIVVCVFLANLFRYMERMVASRLRLDIILNMRARMYENITRMHLGFFNEQRRGDMLSRFTNDMSEVENTVVNSLKSVLKEPLTIIVYFIVLFVISVKLTLFTLILLPVTGAVVAEIIKRLRARALQSQQAMGRIVNLLDETFGGMRVIKAFNARNFLINKMNDELKFHRKVNLSLARKNELSSPLSEFLGVIIVAAIMYYGGKLVLAGNELQPQVFMGYLAFYASMIQPAKNFSNGITSLQKGTVAAKRIFELMDAMPAIWSKPDAKRLTEFKDAIEFRSVSFSYNHRPVLKNISLKIEKGKTVALVGPSGAGKSTLADLIPRFYDPTEGQIILDGIPLTEYRLDDLRALMGIVTQEPILFNDTIFNNIAFGMPDVHEAEVIRAAKIANAHDFIMQTENGYDTIIGDRGTKLSGGQRQRIAIARAILKNPPILILDEATSALDSESERLVQDALTRLMQNRTSVVIAHRLSTIQHADQIVVIQDGIIAEQGRHHDLLLRNGLYKKLIEMQKT